MYIKITFLVAFSIAYESFFLNCLNGGSSTTSDCPETFIKGKQSSWDDMCKFLAL